MKKKLVIQLNPKDLPKQRDPNRVPLIGRKKGAHADIRKDAERKKCRQKVREDE